MDVLRWRTISNIHQAKYIQSFSIWFVVTPILAKIVTTESLSQFIDVNLPFSWKIFYAAALCFFISNILYILFCPQIIKQYNGWGHYKTSSYSYEKLIPCLFELLKNVPRADRQIFIHRQVVMENMLFYDENNKLISDVKLIDTETPKTLSYSLQNSDASASGLADIYSATEEKSQHLYFLKRLIITILIYCGFALIFYVLMENVFAVFWGYKPHEDGSLFHYLYVLYFNGIR